MNSPNLTSSEVRKLSSACRAAGWTLPKVGYSVDVPVQHRAAFRSPTGYLPKRVIHDVRGYFFTY
jgi:hypothetical protein